MKLAVNVQAKSITCSEWRATGANSTRSIPDSNTSALQTQYCVCLDWASIMITLPDQGNVVCGKLMLQWSQSILKFGGPTIPLRTSKSGPPGLTPLLCSSIVHNWLDSTPLTYCAPVLRIMLNWLNKIAVTYPCCVILLVIATCVMNKNDTLLAKTWSRRCIVVSSEFKNPIDYKWMADHSWISHI